MAIYHLTAQFISRGDGRSAVAAAAYRHGSEMYFDLEGRTLSYSHKDEVIHNDVALPDETPQWFREEMDGRTAVGVSEALWNAVETHFSRANAQLAKEIEFALPRELSVEQNIALTRAYLKRFTDRGHVVTWAYHNKDGNPHVHAMMTLAPLTEGGFGKTQVPVYDKAGERVYVTRKNGKRQAVSRPWAGEFGDTLKADREAWSVCVNRHLEMAGVDQRVSHLSHAARGIDDIEPQIHLGSAAKAMLEKDAFTDRSRRYAAIRARNLSIIQEDPERILDILTEKQSVFDSHDIAKSLHSFVDDPRVFRHLHTQITQSPALVPIRAERRCEETGKIAERQLFTTRDMLKLEIAMVQRACRMDQADGFWIHERNIKDALTKREFLSDEQIHAVRHATSQNRLSCIVGAAGSGKTTMLEAAREAWEAQGFRVVGAALAGKAAQELQDSAGIPSRTLASLEWAIRSSRYSLTRNDVLVVDEAGMVGSRQLDRILEHAETAGAKVALVGDPAQLQPIAAGGAFRAILERTGYAEINTIRRQKADWQREASQAFSRGDAAEGLRNYRAHNKTHGFRLKVDAVEGLAIAYAEDYIDGKNVLALAHSNKDVAALNQAIRAQLGERGALGQPAPFETSRGPLAFSPGDRMVFLQNDRELGVKNGTLATVESASHNRLAVTTDTGANVIIGAGRYNSVAHGYAVTIHKSQGATVDNTHVLATRGMDRNLAYVAMTRHRQEADLYFGVKSFPAKDGGIEAYMSRINDKKTSVDYLEAIEFGDRRGHDTFKALKERLVTFIEKGEEQLRKGVHWLFGSQANSYLERETRDKPVKKEFEEVRDPDQRATDVLTDLRSWADDRNMQLPDHEAETSQDSVLTNYQEGEREVPAQKSRVPLKDTAKENRDEGSERSRPSLLGDFLGIPSHVTRDVLSKEGRDYVDIEIDVAAQERTSALKDTSFHGDEDQGFEDQDHSRKKSDGPSQEL